jgi:hypothetical protein
MQIAERIHIGSKLILRFNLENESAPREQLAKQIAPLWREYEPWASDKDIADTISSKQGRVIDVVYDAKGCVCGFYIFRVFQHVSQKVMFRGNSYSGTAKGTGAVLFQHILNEYKPDLVVAFTPQPRAFAFLSHFGELLPNADLKVTEEELTLLSRLAGAQHHINPETLIVSNFYRGPHVLQGNPLRDSDISEMFATLGERDAYALVLRCKH